MKKLVAVAVVAVFLVAGCGGDQEQSPGTETSSSSEFSFGEPASADSASRTVKVEALDELAFDPPQLTVDAGETVRFVVTNAGSAPHEFVLGDSDYQTQHEEDMEHGGHGTSTENVVEVEPGETQEITWTFTSPGEVLYACHVEGHYKGGMVGTVTVEG